MCISICKTPHYDRISIPLTMILSSVHAWSSRTDKRKKKYKTAVKIRNNFSIKFLIDVLLILSVYCIYRLSILLWEKKNRSSRMSSKQIFVCHSFPMTHIWGVARYGALVIVDFAIMDTERMAQVVMCAFERMHRSPMHIHNAIGTIVEPNMRSKWRTFLMFPITTT